MCMKIANGAKNPASSKKGISTNDILTKGVSLPQNSGMYMDVATMNATNKTINIPNIFQMNWIIFDFFIPTKK